jgi:hypothetical protein
MATDRIKVLVKYTNHALWLCGLIGYLVYFAEHLFWLISLSIDQTDQTPYNRITAVSILKSKHFIGNNHSETERGLKVQLGT